MEIEDSANTVDNSMYFSKEHKNNNQKNKL